MILMNFYFKKISIHQLSNHISCLDSNKISWLITVYTKNIAHSIKLKFKTSYICID